MKIVAAKENSSDIGKLILRLTVGGLMLPHGISKLGGSLDFIKGLLANFHLPEFIAYGVFVGEIIVPILIIIGFKTCWASLIFIANMFFIILLAHAKDIFAFSSVGGFELETVYLYMFGALSLVFLGGGKYSVDRE